MFSKSDYQLRIALASLLVIAMAVPLGLFALSSQTRLDSQAINEFGPRNINPNPAPIAPVISGQPSQTACIVSGCNGEVCAPAGTGPIYSTCEWRQEYACYRSAQCAIQADGRCGWTQTEQLLQCLQNSGDQIQISDPQPQNQPPSSNTIDPNAPVTPSQIQDRDQVSQPDTATYENRQLIRPLPTTAITPSLSVTNPGSPVCDIVCPHTFTLTENCDCLPPEPPLDTVGRNNGLTPPSLATSSLPQAVKNRLYLTQIELSSSEPNSRLQVRVDGLPQGLTLENCTPTISSFGQSLSRCTLSGIPDSQARAYRLTFYLSDGLGNSAVETRDLEVISSESWLYTIFSRLGRLFSTR